ncbi:MAG: UDP-3-O-(3-hydroxymyristoyl)glucosamine N-acyltransferase [Saprospiraceae bacterium]
MEIKISVLATILNGEIEGDPNIVVTQPSRIEEAEEGSITFLGNPKYEQFVYSTNASALLVSKDFKPKQPIKPALIRVENVYAAVSMLMEKFSRQNSTHSGISGQATLSDTASIGEGTSIGPYAVVSPGADLGPDCQIGAQVYIGKAVKIGARTILYPGVRIMDGCTIGTDCILHANAVIGADGFGFAPQEDGSYRKIPQLGNVIVEDNVEIGANCTIDRASLGSTIIRRGVKLDNLIHVAHNVEIGENTAIAAQTGIAGSAKIGQNCQIGGQVGIAGHIQVADRTKIQAQSAVASTVKKTDTAICGYPAIDYSLYLRAIMVFKQLPDFYKRFLAIEREFNNKG